MNLKDLELSDNIKEILLKNKRQEYRDYLLKHKQAVKDAYVILQNRILNTENSPLMLSESEKELVNKIIEEHDNSKLGDDEFEGYRQWWYPIFPSYEYDEELYRQSKEIHKNKNGHHWDNWINGNSIKEIPNHYICELLCDWYATSRFEGSESLFWYEEQLKNDLIKFAPHTKETIEKCLLLLNMNNKGE